MWIKNYWKKEKNFKRIGEEIFNVDLGEQSIANVCKVEDKVNGEVVKQVLLGMNFCYCVFTENGHCYYSWDIKTIETKIKKYNIVEKNNKILIEEEKYGETN